MYKLILILFNDCFIFITIEAVLLANNTYKIFNECIEGFCMQI
jgi:hypothetical protein